MREVFAEEGPFSLASSPLSGFFIVSLLLGANFASENNWPFFETSAKFNLNVTEAFTALLTEFRFCYQEVKPRPRKYD